MKQNSRLRKFFLLVTALAVFVFSNCKHDAGGKDTSSKKPVEKFTVDFTVKGSGGNLAAEVDGNAISTGSKVEKGKTVIFTLKLDPSSGYFLQKWEGAVPDSNNEYKASLKVTGNAKVQAILVNDETLPQLKLVSLNIYGEDVDIEKMAASVYAESLSGRDIEAKFTYGEETVPRKIKVQLMEAGKIVENVFILDEGGSIFLNVPILKGKYKKWSGKVKIRKRIPVEFAVNGKAQNIMAIPNKKEGGSAPEIHVIDIKGSLLNLKIANESDEISKITVNGKDFSDDIKEYIFGSKLNYSKKLENIAAGDEISVVVTPSEDKFDISSFKFKVKGNNENVKENILPKLVISDNAELPKATFMDKLTDGSLPLYKTKKSPAKLEIHFSEYENDFLLEQLSINGEEVEVIEDSGFTIFGNAKKDIPVETASAKDITVKFKPKDSTRTNALEWRFRLQGGGENTPLSMRYATIFTINGEGKKGLTGNSFTQEFLDHLNDGTNPLYTFDGGSEGKAEFKIGCFEFKNGVHHIEKVIYTVDSEAPVTVETKRVANGQDVNWISSFEKTLSNQAGHTVKIEIVPVDTSKYSNLVLTFKVKNSGEPPAIPNLRFYIDRGLPEESGYKAKEPLSGELAELSMQTNEDTVASVQIGSEDNLKDCEILTGWSSSLNQPIFAAEQNIKMPTDGSYKKFIIRVTPKDKTKYKVTDFICFLTGTKVSAGNAEFVKSSNNKPYVYQDPVFYDGQSRRSAAYGAKKTKITACTVSPRSKVKYKFVDLLGQTLTMPGDSSPQIKEMISDGLGKHTAEITMYDDKPVNVIAYVVAEDNSTDNIDGVWTFAYNNVLVRWSKEAGASVQTGFKNYVYDTIYVDKSKLDNNTLYAAFGVWRGPNYTADEKYAYPQHQKVPEEDEDDGTYKWYKTDIDVSSLTASNELEIVVPILEKGKACLTHKVKIKQL